MEIALDFYEGLVNYLPRPMIPLEMHVSNGAMTAVSCGDPVGRAGRLRGIRLSNSNASELIWSMHKGGCINNAGPLHYLPSSE